MKSNNIKTVHSGIRILAFALTTFAVSAATLYNSCYIEGPTSELQDNCGGTPATCQKVEYDDGSGNAVKGPYVCSHHTDPKKICDDDTTVNVWKKVTPGTCNNGVCTLSSQSNPSVQIPAIRKKGDKC